MNLEKKDITLEERITQCIESLFHIIDYNENDLGRFLALKHFGKYYTYVFIKFLFTCFYVIFICLAWFTVNYSLGILDITLNFIYVLLGVFFLVLYIILDNLTYKRFKYSISLYIKKRKRLQMLLKKLNLILNNHALKKQIKEQDYNNFKKDFQEISQKIDVFESSIKTYSHYISNFGFFMSLIVPFIAYFISVIDNLMNSLYTIDLNVFIDFIFDLGIVFMLISMGICLVYMEQKEWISYDKSFLEFQEGLVFGLLEIIRLKLTIIEFPQEEKFKKELPEIMKKIEEVKSKYKNK